jgi:hypothetical protein
MQESFSSEHGSKLFANSLEQFLDGSGVSDEGGGHFQASGRDVANSSFDVVGNPFNKVGAVLVLDIQHLFVNLLHGHAASEDSGNCQVTAMAGITSGHHIFGIKHLLCELGYSESSILLAASGGQGGKAGNEKVQSGEGHHVYSQFSQICIELTGEPKTSCDT